jgi:hypothetical protein
MSILPGKLAPRRRLSAALLALGTTLVLAAPAAATPGGSTRDEYVRRVEPICESATRANGGVLAGVEGMVRHGELRRAAPRLQHAATALGATIDRLAPVPRPRADAPRLQRWLGLARGGEALLERMADKLRRDDPTGVQGLADDLLRQAKRANATVVGFDFDYCRVNPARFV